MLSITHTHAHRTTLNQASVSAPSGGPVVAGRGGVHAAGGPAALRVQGHPLDLQAHPSQQLRLPAHRAPLRARTTLRPIAPAGPLTIDQRSEQILSRWVGDA